MDTTQENLLNNGVKIELLEKEKRLLKLLLSKKGDTVFYEDIINELWDDSFFKEVSLNSVKNQVSLLRKKLSKNIIISVYSQGYKLN